MTGPRPAVTLRAARAADARFVLDLEEQGMRGYATELWGDWRPSATIGTIDLTGHRIVMAEGAAVGCAAVEQAADHHRLRKLYVLPSRRNAGLGAAALAHIVAEAADAGRPVRLSVLTTNPAAAAFYRRSGFVETSRDAERIWMERGG